MDELVVNVMNTPVEAVESEFPVRVERYELVQDSAGPGTLPRRARRRGATGASSPRNSVINMRSDRFKFASPGIFGAKPARPSRGRAQSRHRRRARPLTSKVAGLRLKTRRSSVVGTRRRRRLGRSLRRAIRARARRTSSAAMSRARRRGADYGVALDADDLAIDADATRAAARQAQAKAVVRLRVGIDVGGTFTDVTGFDEERGVLVLVRKYPSDPARPGAVMDDDHARSRDGVRRATRSSLVLHGSTAALNTMLEDKGVKRRPYRPRAASATSTRSAVSGAATRCSTSSRRRPRCC